MTIKAFSTHRSFDRRINSRMTQFNEMMETGVISTAAHSVVRPLVVISRDAVRDALESKLRGQSAEEVHRSYDDRIDEVLAQENEMAEQGVIDQKTHGLCRSVLESFRPIVFDALVSAHSEDG